MERLFAGQGGRTGGVHVNLERFQLDLPQSIVALQLWSNFSLTLTSNVCLHICLQAMRINPVILLKNTPFYTLTIADRNR